MEVQYRRRRAANRGPLMKLIYNNVCILMKQAGLCDDTRPPSPRPALIHESNAPLGASDPRDV